MLFFLQHAVAWLSPTAALRQPLLHPHRSSKFNQPNVPSVLYPRLRSQHFLTGIVYGNGVEDALAPFPVGHTAGKQLVKASGVVEVQPVAEFVHNDVFDAVNRRLYEVDVERDPAETTAAPPSGPHGSDYDRRLRNTMPTGDLKAGLKIAGKHVVRSLAVPCRNCGTHTLGVPARWNKDVQETAAELCGLEGYFLNLETVLPPQVNEGLSADVPAGRLQRMKRLHLVELPRNPRGLFADRRKYGLFARG